MNLASELKAAKENRSLTQSERALVCCRLAKQLEKAGEYEEGCDALDDFWRERQGDSKLEGLDEETKALVFRGTC